MAKRRYAVVGAGAVGGYYGARLQKAGFEVHFLLHSDYEYVAEKGLRVDSVEGDFSIEKVAAYNKAADMPKCDVVLVTLKTTQNHLLKKILPPLLQRDSIVLLLQNGLGEEERIGGFENVGTIVSGLAFVCSTKVGPGHIVHQDYGSIRLAGYRVVKPGPEKPAQEIAADFAAAGIVADVDVDSRTARWKKLVWNIPFNGLSVVCDADTAALVGSPPARELVRTIMTEVVAAAQACGAEVPRSVIEAMIENTEKMRPYYPSMKLDFDANRPMELDAMYKTPLEHARAAGFHMVRTDLLYRELFVKEYSCRGRSNSTFPGR